MTDRGNTGAWFNKNNWKDMRLIFNPKEQPPEGFVRAQPLRGTAYQRYDEAEGKWAADPDSEALEKIDGCKAELAAIDREAGAGRAVRGLALAAAEKAGIKTAFEGDDFDRIQKYEARAGELRANIERLKSGMGTGGTGEQ